MVVELHNGVHVLRDDLLPGGTKSVILNQILDKSIDEWIYASPVYGGLQIALSDWCKQNRKKATIFCAKRNHPHPNTDRCQQLGAKVIQVPYGYLHVVQNRAATYCKETDGSKLIPFGLDLPESRVIIADRMRELNQRLGGEPDEIWCALGSGILLEGLVMGTERARINGVQVGKPYDIGVKRFMKGFDRVRIHKHHLPFEKDSTYETAFQSMANYDRKAWEYCNLYKSVGNVLFWNVY